MCYSYKGFRLIARAIAVTARNDDDIESILKGSRLLAVEQRITLKPGCGHRVW